MVLVDILPPRGFDPQTDVCSLVTHAALVEGDVVVLDLTAVDSTSLLFYKTAAYAAGSTGGVGQLPAIYLCALETIASGATGRLALRGNIRAKVLTTSVALGDPLCPTTAGSATSLSESSTPIIASSVKVIALARQTNAVANAVIEVMFDGYSGLFHGGVPS